MNNSNLQNEKDMKLYSRVLVGLVSSDVWAVDFLAKYSNDADEENEVHLWSVFKCYVRTIKGYFTMYNKAVG